MKKLLIILLFYSVGYAQVQYKISDSNFKKLISVSTEVANKVKLVEHSLQENQYKLDSNSIDIYDPYIQLIKVPFSQLSEKQQKKANELVCIDCYEKWWKSQLSYKNNEIERKKTVTDSIEGIRIQKNVLDKKIQDSLKTVAKSEKVVVSEKDKPYELLDRSLYAFSKTNRSLTVFRKMDYNYAAPKLSGFLQFEMALASKNYLPETTTITETFTPKVADGSEYLKVKYNITNRSDIVGIYEAKDVNVINSVEITGTPDLIIRLFISYWPQKIKLSGYKKGVIAYQELLGDHIALLGVSPNLYKIEISKGNMDVDYETTYGINKKK